MLKDEPFELVVTGLSKAFYRKVLWSDLSFTVPSGSMTAVRGASGAGKTTLLNCIGRLEEFDSGSITFGPWSFAAGSRMSSRRCFRDVLGFLFQNYGLVETWNVRRNLALPLSITSGSRGRGAIAMAEALERVGMKGAEGEKVYTLSGGEQQRVALARLTLKSPSLILADEPTSALDQANADLVMEILAEQAAGGSLVLISTHSDDISGRCQQTVALDGTIDTNKGANTVGAAH